MIFGILSSAGKLISLIGAVILFRWSPSIYGDMSWDRLRAIPERSDVLRAQRRAWAWIAFGFLLQFMGSLVWLRPLASEVLSRVLAP